MKANIVTAIMLSLSSVLGAQEYNYLPKDYGILPPSPSVSDLLAVEDFDVDYHQGRPSISFTLYSVNDGDLTVPITMVYQSGGIRVGQKPSNLGVGWNLSASGVIGRSVVGVPDEVNLNTRSGAGLRGLYHLTEEDKEFRDFYIKQNASYDPSNYITYQKLIQPIADKGKRYYNGLSDMANDIYNVCAPGLNATFVKDEQGNMAISSAEPIKVNETDALFFSTTDILNPQSIKYHFSTHENSKFIYTHGVRTSGGMLTDTCVYVSAVHLTEMSNIQNDKISFSYIDGKPVMHGGASESETYCINPDYQSRFGGHQVGSSCGITTPKLLQSISGRGVKVNFYYSAQKAHYLPQMIDSITVCYVKTPNIPVKTFKFQYNSKNFLVGVSCNGQKLYSFEYYNIQHRNGVDFGGFPNDRNYSGSNVPECPVINSKGADRSVNPSVAMHDCLKSIIYPTGGQTVFEWESHDFSMVNDEELSEIINTPSISSTSSCELCGLKNMDLRCLKIENYTIQDNCAYGLDFSNYYELDPTLLSSTFKDKHGVDNLNKKYPCVAFINSLTKKDVRVIYIDNNTFEEIKRFGSKELRINLAPGKYDIELRYPTEFDLISGYNVDTYFGKECTSGGIVTLNEHSLSGANINSPGKKKEFWPGVRIKKITYKLDSDSVAYQKRFLYENHTYNVKSSGVVSHLPNFASRFYMVADVGDKIYSSGLFTEVYVMHEDGLMYNILNDPLIEYSTVGVKICREDEVETDNLANYSWYHYTTAKDKANQDFFIFCPYDGFQAYSERRPVSRGYRRGLMTKVEMASTPGGLNKTLENVYSISEQTSNLLFTTGLFVIGDFTQSAMGGVEGPEIAYSIGKYSLVNNNVRLSQTIEKENYIYSTTTNYTYFNDNSTPSDEQTRNLLKKRTVTTPDNVVTATHYSYTTKTTSESKNFVIPVIEAEFQLEGSIVNSARRYVYGPDFRLLRTYSSNKQMRFSESLYDGFSAKASLLDQLDREEFEYSYYQKGCLREIKYRGKIMASYLWDDVGVHPIAEGRFISADLLRSLYDKFKSGNVPSEILRQHDFTVLEWAPLIGIITQYDSRGIPTHYDYDTLGRLKTISDYNNHLISRYLYNYSHGNNF